MQHDLGYAAGEEDAHGGMADGSVGQRVHEARGFAIHGDPIVNGRAAQSGGVSDGGNVKQQIR